MPQIKRYFFDPSKKKAHIQLKLRYLLLSCPLWDPEERRQGTLAAAVNRNLNADENPV